MYQDEKISLIFSQNGNLLAGFLAENPKDAPEFVVRDLFESTYKTLVNEFNKDYIKKLK